MYFLNVDTSTFDQYMSRYMLGIQYDMSSSGPRVGPEPAGARDPGRLGPGVGPGPGPGGTWAGTRASGARTLSLSIYIYSIYI